MGTDDERGRLSEGQRAEIVTSLYDTALDPSLHYERLIDVWEEKVGPILRLDGEKGGEFLDTFLEDHAQRAAMVLDRTPAEIVVNPLHALLNSLLPTAAFVVEPDGTVRQSNAAAVSVFGVRGGDAADALPFDADEIELYRTEVQSVAGLSAGNRYLRCHLGDGGRVVVFRLSPLDPSRYGGQFVLAISTELAWPEALSVMIKDAFQLTSAEIDIVRGLVEGQTIGALAASRERSLETIRTQVKSILNKTRTKSQADLLRVTLNLMDMVGGDSERMAARGLAGSAAAGQLAPVPFQTLWRPDGRRADYVILGDPAGRPIIFMPMKYGLIRWPAVAEALARRNGYKVIVPIRPGYGHSSPVPRRASRVDVVSDDLLALMDHLGVAAAPVIALGPDSFFAYSFARRHPGRLTAILICGGGFPTLSHIQLERMSKWHRFVRANARYAPKILPFLIKAGFSLARRIGKAGFVRLVHQNSPNDLALCDTPEIFEALLTGSEISFSDWHSAHEAFAEEVILQQQDWSELMSACDLPQIVFIGGEDPSAPPETLAEIKKAFPKLHYVEDQHAGELIFFKRWRDVLAEAVQYLPS
jgi:pimeloyl-ACP methyl ester carboxylesterase/DNA-binding CsgD family transcriptional regulator